jgi:hypothetical protein
MLQRDVMRYADRTPLVVMVTSPITAMPLAVMVTHSALVLLVTAVHAQRYMLLQANASISLTLSDSKCSCCREATAAATAWHKR